MSAELLTPKQIQERFGFRLAVFYPSMLPADETTVDVDADLRQLENQFGADNVRQIEYLDYGHETTGLFVSGSPES